MDRDRDRDRERDHQDWDQGLDREQGSARDRNIISDNCVVIFSKTTCPYCKMAKELFEGLNVHYTAVELDRNTNGRQFQDILEQMTGGRTLMKAACPQQVLGLQWECLQHNSPVHKEVVNIVALFSYPNEELDLDTVVFGLTPAAVDSMMTWKCLLWWCIP
ncbi:hypothetical protein WISP_100222 [Willisornis vidua]|uniref:Glutaredoxin domain-containing protein n=1 Tax=Willisornis vidua TaxID=1566151 RepID=A0ABQ9CYV1_9PASS|nr:hypothetical protein WISP_100222 [Willisornis vidua]